MLKLSILIAAVWLMHAQANIEEIKRAISRKSYLQSLRCKSRFSWQRRLTRCGMQFLFEVRLRHSILPSCNFAGGGT